MNSKATKWNEKSIIWEGKKTRNLSFIKKQISKLFTFGKKSVMSEFNRVKRGSETFLKTVISEIRDQWNPDKRGLSVDDKENVFHFSKPLSGVFDIGKTPQCSIDMPHVWWHSFLNYHFAKKKPWDMRGWKILTKNWLITTRKSHIRDWGKKNRTGPKIHY